MPLHTEKHNKNVLLSFVGFSAAGPVAAIRTWIAQEGVPARILLLETPDVRKTGVADRVSAALSVPDDDRILINSRLTTADDLSTAQREIATRAVFPDGAQAVFYADAGLRWHAAVLARLLPDDAICLHAERGGWLVTRRLGTGEMLDPIKIFDLGFDELMALGGFKPKRGARRPEAVVALTGIHVPKTMKQDVHILPDAASLDLAYERSGWIHGLRIAARKSARGRGKKSQAELKKRVRETQGLLLPLRRAGVVLTVGSDDTYARTRAVEAGLRAIPLSGINAWIGEAMAPPVKPLWSVPAAVGMRSCDGGGGDGAPLALWMGADPTATLLSLFTHRPKSAAILYDATSPRVCVMTERLEKVRRQIPANRIHLIPSTFFGHGVVEALRALRDGEAFKVDVTAGTQPQALALAGARAAQTWCLASSDTAVRLDRWDSRPTAAPPLIVLAEMCGGSFDLDDQPLEQPENRRFVRLLGRALARYLANGLDRGRSITEIPKCPTQSWGSIEPLGDGRVRVTLDGETATGTKPLTNGGNWLEWVTAGAFMDAGAEEVRVGIRWMFPDSREPMNEADVAARVGKRMFVVEGKSARTRTGGKVKAGRIQVEAVAPQGFGSYAIPVVARPRVDPALFNQQLDARRGALLIDLALLADSPRFKEFIGRVLKTRGGGPWS